MLSVLRARNIAMFRRRNAPCLLVYVSLVLERNYEILVPSPTFSLRPFFRLILGWIIESRNTLQLGLIRQRVTRRVTTNIRRDPRMARLSCDGPKCAKLRTKLFLFFLQVFSWVTKLQAIYCEFKIAQTRKPMNLERARGAEKMTIFETFWRFHWIRSFLIILRQKIFDSMNKKAQQISTRKDFVSSVHLNDFRRL